MNDLPRFTTARTVVKLLHPDDAELVSAYYLENAAHLQQWEPTRAPEFFAPGACRTRAADAYTAFTEGKTFNFIALDPVSGKMIASCNFNNIVRGVFMACHMGYSIAAAYQGKGLMQEVAQACIRYMFDEVGLHRVMANHMPANLRSAAMLQRLGFEREGYARAYLRINGKWEDHVLNTLINPAQG